MKKYHKLGYIIRNGKCRIAYYDVLKGRVSIVSALDWKLIADELCTDAENQSLQMRWEDWEKFSWNDCFAKIRGH